MEFKKCKLSNGMRLIHKQVSSPVSHCGVIINTGSRDEGDDEHGMAHLIEHLMFKGTKKRKAYHILSRMEDVGGELNAYTTKEETAVYTTFFNNYYQRAFDLLHDIIFQSVFPAKEVKKEKEIIIDEINSYKDSPVEMIFDEFEEQLIAEGPLSRNILGTSDSLYSHSLSKIKSFYREKYTANRMVVSSVSNLSFEKVKKYFENSFSSIEVSVHSNSRPTYNKPKSNARRINLERETHQAHCIVGNFGYSFKDDKRLILHLINNLLGGPGMNSRLNLALREKRGYAYNVESNYTSYVDTGLVSIYFGTDRKNLNKCLNIINKELELLRFKKMGVLQLSKAKKQLIGQIALSSENNENQMLSIGKSMLVYNKVDSLEDIRRKIENIRASEIFEVANEVFNPALMQQLVYS